MKSLFWKEWRENRVNLLIGIVFFVGISLWSLFYYPTRVLTQGGFLAAQEMWLILIFTGYFGAHSFSKEKGAFEFLLSIPVARKVIFLEKWLTGILSIFIILIVAIAVEGIFYKINNLNLLSYNLKANDFLFGWPHWSIIHKKLLGLLPGFFLYYNITFLLSILFTETYIAILVGLILYSALMVLSLALLKLSLNGPHPLSLDSPLGLDLIISLIFLLIIPFVSYRIFMRKEVKT